MPKTPHDPDPLAEAAHLRHQARAALNSIAGLCESALEDAEAGDIALPDALWPTLERILSLSRQLLDLSNDLAVSSREPMHAPLGALLALCGGARASGGSGEAGQVLERVRHAAMALGELLGISAAPESAAPVDARERIWLIGGAAGEQESLAALGFRAEAIADAQSALQVLEARRSGHGPGLGLDLDLVLLSASMPGALQVLAELRSGTVAGAWVPVVVLCEPGQPGLEAAARGIEAGADDFLARPFRGVLWRARIAPLLARGARG